MPRLNRKHEPLLQPWPSRVDATRAPKALGASRSKAEACRRNALLLQPLLSGGGSANLTKLYQFEYTLGEVLGIR